MTKTLKYWGLKVPSDFETLGDPHLGRRFFNGVPLHRRGEREEAQMANFKNNLLSATKQVHVCMGDIFDKFIVSPSVVLAAAEAYYEAAEKNSSVQYYLIMGNHDGSRDATIRSSFDILEALLRHVPNVTVVKGEPHTTSEYAFIPWHPFITAEDMAKKLEGKFEAIFGHWDIDTFGSENTNLVPLDILREHSDLIITGHVHHPEERDIDGLKLIVTGSMEPYAHGEDPTDEFYRTVSLEEARQLAESGEAKGLCLRILLKKDEVLDFDVDCLQLTLKREKSEDDEIEVDYSSFDLDDLFHRVMEEFHVSNSVTETFWGRLKNRF